MTGLDVLILIFVVLMAMYLPKEKDIFRIARVGCSSTIWVPTDDKLEITCQLASAGLKGGGHVKCALENCPIVNEHMKGKLKYPSDTYNEAKPYEGE